MSEKIQKQQQRIKRHKRARFYLSGTTARPRLAVFRSINHIYAQIIDDEKGVTLAAASSTTKDMREKKVAGGNKDGAKKVGIRIAEIAREKGIEAVVFDKGGFQYHGRVKELAEGARSAGLKF